MEYKHLKLWLLCCCFCAHSLVFWDKWFCQKYLSVGSKQLYFAKNINLKSLHILEEGASGVQVRDIDQVVKTMSTLNWLFSTQKYDDLKEYGKKFQDHENFV